LKSQIPIQTWADWDDRRPGFLEIDLVCHEGGDNNGDFAFSLTVTDIATGFAGRDRLRTTLMAVTSCRVREVSYRFATPRHAPRGVLLGRTRQPSLVGLAMHAPGRLQPARTSLTRH
jgi:hypothetical protein